MSFIQTNYILKTNYFLKIKTGCIIKKIIFPCNVFLSYIIKFLIFVTITLKVIYKISFCLMEDINFFSLKYMKVELIL